MRQAYRWVARAIASAPPLAILAFGWFVVLVYAYPGHMVWDSYDHLREVRDGVWTDWHPPAMNLLWLVADFVVAGPFAMLVFQTALFAAGLYLVFRRTLAPRRAAWAATGLFLFPPVMLSLTVIWKDAPMAGLLLLGAALLHAERRARRIAGLVALGLATALRYNTFGATFPLILLAFEWQPGAHWVRRYAIAAAAWIAVTAGAFALNAALSDRKMQPWYSSLALFDIGGTLAYVDRTLPDAELEQLLAGTDLRVHSKIHDAIRLARLPEEALPPEIRTTRPLLWQLPMGGYVLAPEPQREAIGRAFRDVITGNLGAYLRHRLAMMADVLCLTRAPTGVVPSRTIRYPDVHRSLGIGDRWSKLQHGMTWSQRWVSKHTPIFAPWIYAAIALVLLPLARRHRDVLALLLSGLGLELSLLPLAMTPDFRYSHWMILCTCIAVIVLTVRRARAAQHPRRVDLRPLSTASAPR